MVLQLSGLATQSEALRIQKKLLGEQRAFQERLMKKTISLVETDAAPAQRIEELALAISQLSLQVSGNEVSQKALRNQSLQIRAGLDVLDDQLRDFIVRTPTTGVVLETYVHQGEWVVPGMGLADVANLKDMTAKIYLSSEALTQMKLGQRVWVTPEGSADAVSGVVSWISSEAEFTPKTILTPETRETLVYAVKIRVFNSKGQLKLGQPVDVTL